MTDQWDEKARELELELEEVMYRLDEVSAGSHTRALARALRAAYGAGRHETAEEIVQHLQDTTSANPTVRAWADGMADEIRERWG